MQLLRPNGHLFSTKDNDLSSCPFPYTAGDLWKEVNEEQIAKLNLPRFEVENDDTAGVKGSPKTTDGKKTIEHHPSYLPILYGGGTPYNSCQAGQTYSEMGVRGYG